MSTAVNRRVVKGLAFHVCTFCGRNKTDKQNRPYNYQYLDETTGKWDTEVYCTKECRKAWHTENALAARISRGRL